MVFWAWNRYLPEVSFPEMDGGEAMAKSARKSSSGSASGTDTVDKIAKAAMSKEMLAAGLAAASPAIRASPKVRRAIPDAGLEAADATIHAASEVVARCTE